MDQSCTSCLHLKVAYGRMCVLVWRLRVEVLVTTDGDV